MADKAKAKGILAKIKALFDAVPAPAPAPTGTVAATPCSYNVDGGVPVYVDISDDNLPGIDAMDKVFTDAALTLPYPDGTYTVTGSQFSFTVAGGVVSAVTDAAGTGPGTPVTAAAPTPAPIPAPAPQPVTQAQMQEMSAKFGSGNSEDRLSNIELMLKALMDYSFGWQIQQAQQAEAITAYRDTIATIQAASQTDKGILTEQAEKLKKQDEIITQVLELASALVDEPTDQPKTVTGIKKERLDRMEKGNEKFQGIVAGLKAARTTKRY